MDPAKLMTATSKGLGNSQTTHWYDDYAVMLWDSDEEYVDMAEATKASLEGQNRATQASLEAPDFATEEWPAAYTKPLEMIKEFVTVTFTRALITK